MEAKETKGLKINRILAHKRKRKGPSWKWLPLILFDTRKVSRQKDLFVDLKRSSVYKLTVFNTEISTRAVWRNPEK